MKKSSKPAKTIKNKMKFLVISLAVLTIVISYSLYYHPETPSKQNEKKIAIIDGLSATYENKTFWWTIQDMVKQAGYTTYYYQAGSDMVNFYRNLPLYNFKIIILRVHSALNPENTDLAIFTNEKWSDGKASTTYLNDIINDRIVQVRIYENSTAYFGLTSKFIKAMNGNFQNTIIIMMGCDGMSTTTMAKAFIEKGAEAYIGWNGPVTPKYVDSATIKLLKHLVIEGKSISEAVSLTAEEAGSDPYYGSKICTYPG